MRVREFAGFCAIFASLFLFITAYAFAAAEDSKSGQKLFEGKCSQCHGKDAKGDVKMAKVLKVDPTLVDLTNSDNVKLTADDMGKTVTNGHKKMPKFKGKLTADQIKAVVAYIKSLHGGTSADKSSK